MSETKNIKITKLIELLQAAHTKHADLPECAAHIDVEFWIGDFPAALKSIGQFAIKPDVTVTLECAELTRLQQSNAELVEALKAAKVELAALCADPENPDFSIATPNPADTDRLHKAYIAINTALPH